MVVSGSKHLIINFVNFLQYFISFFYKLVIIVHEKNRPKISIILLSALDFRSLGQNRINWFYLIEFACILFVHICLFFRIEVISHVYQIADDIIVDGIEYIFELVLFFRLGLRRRLLLLLLIILFPLRFQVVVKIRQLFDIYCFAHNIVIMLQLFLSLLNEIIFGGSEEFFLREVWKIIFID